VSNKYLTLVALSDHLAVPALTCVEEGDLRLLWQNYDVIRQAVDRIVTAIELTSAAFLDRHLAELDQVERPIWHTDAASLLMHRLSSVGLRAEDMLAVRSASSVEDAANHSFAGVFRTVLNVNGMAAIRTAIEDVWFSAFSRTAVMERLGLGVGGMSPMMTVIIQRMVDAQWAGVAFSHDPISGDATVRIEAVLGLGEDLVSGAVRGFTAQFIDAAWQADAGLEGQHDMLDTIAEIVTVSSDRLGFPTDIEWAFDGMQVWLLQARPITTIAIAPQTDTAIWQVADLYAASDEEIDQVGPAPDFATYFRSKRKPLADFAAQHQVSAGTALIVCANRIAIESGPCLDELAARFHTDAVVLDYSSRVRQQIIVREQLAPRLWELMTDRPTTFVVREFISGDAGIITQELSDKEQSPSVVAEYSSDGLLAINRGTASTWSVLIGPNGQLAGGDAQGQKGLLPNAEQLETLYQCTVLAGKTFGTVQLEWVLAGSRLCLIDFSPLQSTHLGLSANGARVISAGFAAGRPIRVSAHQDLEEISIAASVSLTSVPEPDKLGPIIQQLYDRIRCNDGPAIIVSPRPYAALASLIPHAAGFVFEQASSLCHLAILLREHGVPALESGELYRYAEKADQVVVDSSLV
jgi:rifampicin phosphotransferase